MITFNKKIEKINSIKNNDFYILTDFDGTITKSTSDSSWSSIFKNPKVTKEFVAKCVELYTHYHAHEIDEKLSLAEKSKIMTEWYKKNIITLKEFKITKDVIDYAANNTNIMSFRPGAKEFLECMHKNKVPIIVISAGVGNIIEQFLIKNNCNYPNIYICSNFLEYDDNGLITGVRNNNLIHPLNKSEISLPISIKKKISTRTNTILLVDNITDMNMSTLNKNLYKVGFLDERINERLEQFKENYDLVCTDKTTFTELKEIVELFK